MLALIENNQLSSGFRTTIVKRLKNWHKKGVWPELIDKGLEEKVFVKAISARDVRVLPALANLRLVAKNIARAQEVEPPDYRQQLDAWLTLESEGGAGIRETMPTWLTRPNRYSREVESLVRMVEKYSKAAAELKK